MVKNNIGEPCEECRNNTIDECIKLVEKLSSDYKRMVLPVIIVRELEALKRET